MSFALAQIFSTNHATKCKKNPATGANVFPGMQSVSFNIIAINDEIIV